MLTKSDYMLYLRHPAWLWLKKNRPEFLPEVDASTQAMFDQGHDWEPYVEKLYREGQKLGFNSISSYRTLPDRTKNALKSGALAIFQGRFVSSGLTCISDIIEQEEEGVLKLTEIKASTSVKEEHLYDLAFQYLVLTSSGYQVREINVAYVNNEYVKHGELDTTSLVAFESVTDRVLELLSHTELEVEKAKTIAMTVKMPDPSPRHCGLGSLHDYLPLFKMIKRIGVGSIYDLVGLTPALVGDLEDRGYTNLADIPLSFHNLSGKQKRQIEANLSQKPIINLAGIKSHLTSYKYPLYFLDYETFSTVVPLFDGTRPYEQIPFQYSLHKLTEDGTLTHTEYLHTDSTFPVPSLVKQLVGDIDNKGTIITWNMSFEKGCNTRMGNIFPKFKDDLEAINSRIVDLMKVFSEGHYVDAGFLGSHSIKHVLPTIVPSLSYLELEIKEGGSAQRLWMDSYLKNKPVDLMVLNQNLLKYCELDTLAMVKIYEYLCVL